MEVRNYLESLRTRQLMALLNDARTCGWCYEYIDGEEVVIDHSEIKTVLNTREHIPNKPEAKALRRERAKREK
ncbi:hypothetical protein [Robertmurraya siralis]|uniref:hypothetical protein n=1 Tax=Robertmurraya siralis TaxID=77777 RepID=UPI0010F5F068|nr:hypothetical protein [Robertmurraya siralis]